MMLSPKAAISNTAATCGTPKNIAGRVSATNRGASSIALRAALALCVIVRVAWPRTVRTNRRVYHGKSTLNVCRPIMSVHPPEEFLSPKCSDENDEHDRGGVVRGAAEDPGCNGADQVAAAIATGCDLSAANMPATLSTGLSA